MVRALLLMARDLHQPAAKASQWQKRLPEHPKMRRTPADWQLVYRSVLPCETLAGQGKFSDALPAYEAAHAEAPSSAPVLWVGMATEAAGVIDTAENAYRELITYIPDSHVGYNQLAWLLVSNGGDLDEAQQLAERALSIAPGDPAIKDALGWTLFQHGNPTEALPYLRSAYAAGTSASAPLITYHLTPVEAAMGHADEARKLLDQLLSYGDTAFIFSQDALALRNTLN